MYKTILVTLKRPEWVKQRPQERLTSDEYVRWTDDFEISTDTLGVLYDALRERLDPMLRFTPQKMLWTHTVELDPAQAKDILALIKAHQLVESAEILEGDFIPAEE